MIPRIPPIPTPVPLYAAFVAELRAGGFEGDLSAGQADRTVFSTDNSIYQLRPQAVAMPAATDDLVRIAKLLADPRFREVRVAPRGGGTGTNGQSLTDGLVVDLSRHMNRVLAIDPVRRRVRVQAGVVKDELNAALAPHGLVFPPELSTSNRATIGGMIATDACGQGSCLYGKTRDHVLELTTVLCDGTVWTSAPLDEAELAETCARDDRVGAIHRAVDRIARDNAALIAERFPKLNRCLTGYDLAHIRDAHGRFDLNAVLCGAEGTLGFLAEATLNVVPIPGSVGLVALRYGSFDAALRDARALMRFGAASIETVDSTVLRLAQDDPVWEGVRAFFPEDGGERARGVNLVEFVGGTEAAIAGPLAAMVAALETEGQAHGRRGFTVARDPADVERVWTMRKKAVGLLGAAADTSRGDARPSPFVEDTAVPPEHLADYIAEFRGVLDRHGLTYGMFGHVDAGVLHVRPAIDTRDPAQRALVRAVTEEVVALTQKYGGLLWGEHGKGVRSEFSPRFFGPLYPALQAIKAAFDPGNQFNPGKIAVPDGGALLTVDGVPMKGAHDAAIPDSARAAYDGALHCNGNGACHDWDPDAAMCPSWKGTRERRHAPKGRAQLVRDWLGQLAAAGIDPIAEGARLRRLGPLGLAAALPRRIANTLSGAPDASHAVKEAMDGCLACKACTGQCPIKVDIPRFRARFLEIYHGRYARPPRDYAVGALERMLPLMARAPRLADALTASRPGAWMMGRLGLTHTPRLSGLDLRKEAAARGVALASPARLSALDPGTRARSVVVVQDAFTSHYDAPVVLALLDLLAALGFRPWLAPFAENGKPLHVHGFLGAFAQVARRNADALRALADTGVDLVGLDPSMTLTYRAEYAEMLPAAACPRVHLVQEWLAARLDDAPVASPRTAYRLLPHCTERATAQGSLADWRTVFARLGLDLAVLPAGCCGMAGTYGHETEHRAVSERIYGLSWARHVAAGAEGLLADGFSCRAQVHAIDGRRLAHPVEALLDAVRGDRRGRPMPGPPPRDAPALA